MARELKDVAELRLLTRFTNRLKRSQVIEGEEPFASMIARLWKKGKWRVQEVNQGISRKRGVGGSL